MCRICLFRLIVIKSLNASTVPVSVLKKKALATSNISRANDWQWSLYLVVLYLLLFFNFFQPFSYNIFFHYQYFQVICCSCRGVGIYSWTIAAQQLETTRLVISRWRAMGNFWIPFIDTFRMWWLYILLCLK